MSAVSHTPEGWPRPSGYANARSASGRVVCVAGHTGWDPVTHVFASSDFARQTEQALRNMMSALGAAGASGEHLLRVTWYVTDRDAYNATRREIGVQWRSIVGPHYPAMAVVIVAGLLEPEALVEVEATAVVPE